MELNLRFVPSFMEFEQAKLELDNLINKFQKQVELEHSSSFHRDIISMDTITFACLCKDIGYMPKECARYRGYHIEIDDSLPAYQYKIRREEKQIMKQKIKFEIKPGDLYWFGSVQSGKTFRILNPVPVKYIINKGTTILFWGDGDKTIVKRSKDDKFDKEKAFLWAYFLKHCGMSRSKANKYLRDLEFEDSENINKK